MKLRFWKKTKFGMEFQYKNRGFNLKKNFEIEPSLGMGIRKALNSHPTPTNTKRNTHTPKNTHATTTTKDHPRLWVESFAIAPILPLVCG